MCLEKDSILISQKAGKKTTTRFYRVLYLDWESVCCPHWLCPDERH